MNEKCLRILEFYKIVDLLIEHATSNPGRQMCQQLRPSVTLSAIEQSQTETEDAVNRILRFGSTNFGNNRDFGETLLSLKAGGTLSSSELLHIALLLENVSRVKNYGRENTSAAAEDASDSLEVCFAGLEPLTSLSQEIRRCILSEEEMADDASSNLKRVRRETAATGDRIHTQLTNMLNGSYRSYLQDGVITQRDNRYCIPVKAEYKSMVPGMVHDQSSSGSTFFIEPAAIVTLNNRLKELSMEEADEIALILTDLSSLAALQADKIKENNRLMTLLDFIFAKAALALDMNATKPLFQETHSLKIRKARHPLINKKVVVPIDISLGSEFDLLVITGPNTGGKTVSLKTVGLFTLMGQAGLHIPALDRSELSVFHEVYADIGDEQSIEQSLSTFSSHMTNIIQILKSADENSLCLFDELCAGTDPTEGAALAISILECLHQRQIRSMATTHYSELKVFALTTSGVENACCEFDVKSLSPTYRLLIGIPGKSNAFAISKRLGLSDQVIETAKSKISQSQESFEDLLTSLEQSRLKTEREEADIRIYKTEIETLKKQLEVKQQKLDTSRETMIRDAREEARNILQEAKDYADQTIRMFQKAGPGASMKDLEQTRQTLHSKINEQNNNLSVRQDTRQKSDSSTGMKPNEIKIGDSVKILSLNLTGTISTFPDHSGNLFVQCGIIRTQTNLRDLLPVMEETVTTGGPVNIRGQRSEMGKLKMSKSFSVSPEINLLGKTADEAIFSLDKYLDDAYLAHLPNVRIVHGKGSGILRNAVQKHLKRVRYIESFRLGEYGEGDSGVTIATFKSE